MTQIPIYRAKKIDSDEYIEFESFFKYENDYLSITKILKQNIDGKVSYVITQKIDLTTLSINFPDMLDSQGNKIFASLSDGKGGDICSPDGIEVYFCVQDGCIFLKNEDWGKEISRVAYNNFKVIGIQQ